MHDLHAAIHLIVDASGLVAYALRERRKFDLELTSTVAVDPIGSMRISLIWLR